MCGLFNYYLFWFTRFSLFVFICRFLRTLIERHFYDHHDNYYKIIVISDNVGIEVTFLILARLVNSGESLESCTIGN